MSTTAAIRAYVPRPSPVPATSPNPPPKRQNFVPRTASSKNGSPAPVSEEVRRNADAILKLLGALPAPLGSSPTSKEHATPSPRSSPPSFGSFKAYARAQKRKASDSDSESTLGLGLGLSTNAPSPSPLAPPATITSSSSSTSPARPVLKRARTTNGEAGPPRAVSPAGHELARVNSSSGSVTPRTSSGFPSHIVSPHRQPRSALRNEITTPRGTGDWTTAQWTSAYNTLGARAHTLKRYGDAYLSPSTAKEPLRGKVPEDILRGILYLTDSLCLYLYRNFCEERVNGGSAKTKPYQQLVGLRTFVLSRWNDLRSGDKVDEENKDRVKGMIGLMYLIEAVTDYHMSTTDLRQLNRRGRDLTAVAAAAGSTSSNGVPASNSSAHGPSPASSSASPGAVARSPASSTAQQPELTGDMLKLLSSTATTSGSAQKALGASRHHLSLKTLREVFPHTWDRAINSELADDLLPVPGDTLGCARALDIDEPDTFAWPIELGLQNAVAHVAVFGRALVREFAQAADRPWEAVFNEPSSPEGRSS
ncbi:hypothetical protein Q8F55_001773 [Vanrija albida]|uniref:RNase III domain-containing protein n=1 Tax=Vanrija albida TaxID=181172 RepID=A0ABR3Q7X1_9TREE